MNGKGDSPRSCFSEQYRENYDRIFRTISGEDWKRALERAKRSRNEIREQIRAKAVAKRK